MKRRLLFLLLIFLSQSAIAVGDKELSLIPSWVSVEKVIAQELKWSHLYDLPSASGTPQTRSDDNRQHEFVVKEKTKRIELLPFKVEDVRGIDQTQLVKERDKDLLLPRPDDFLGPEKSLIRIRPSIRLEGNWKMTLSRLRFSDGKPDVRFIFRTEFP